MANGFEMNLEKAALLGDGYVDGMEDAELPRLPSVPPPPAQKLAQEPAAKILGKVRIHKKASTDADKAHAEARHQLALRQLDLKVRVLTCSSNFTTGKLPDGVTATVEEGNLIITQGDLKVVVKDCVEAEKAAERAVKQLEGKLRLKYAEGTLPQFGCDVTEREGGHVVVRYGRLTESFVSQELKERQEEEKREAKRLKLLEQNRKTSFTVIAPLDPNAEQVALSIAALPGQMKGTTRKPKVKGKKQK